MKSFWNRMSMMLVLLMFVMPFLFAEQPLIDDSLYYEGEDGKLWVEDDTVYIEGTDGTSGYYNEDSGFFETEEGNWTFEGDSMMFQATDGSDMFLSTSGPLNWPEEFAFIPKPEGTLVLQIVMPGYGSYAFQAVGQAEVDRYILQLNQAGFEELVIPELVEILAMEAADGNTETAGFYYIAQKGTLSVVIASNSDMYTVMFQPSTDLAF